MRLVYWFCGALALLGAQPASAQSLCAPTAKVLADLNTKYHERPVWGGVVSGGSGPQEFILLQSDEGSWTFLALQGATACIVASGTDGTDLALGQEV